MTRPADPPPRGIALAEYYVVEGLNAAGTTLFFLGIFFHARLIHGFSNAMNLLLAATQGCAYVLATRAGGRLADRVGPERSIAVGLAGMCLALLTGWQLEHPGALFAAIALYSASTALTWPALEAAIARSPGRMPLARRTGLYNLVWSFTGFAGFFAGGALFAVDPDAVFWAPLATHALELAGLAAVMLTRAGGQPTLAAAGSQERHVATRPGLTPAFRARFLKASWVANGLSYFLFGAFAALAPTLGENLGLGPRLTIWLVSTYLLARSASFVLFWRWSGWEYSARWVAVALFCPPAAFAVLFLTASPTVTVSALAALGATCGISYSASLHASLDRDGGEGEGGGLHEWVIGLGILSGPLAGAAGAAIVDGVAGAGGLVAVLGAAAAFAGLAQLFRREPA